MESTSDRIFSLGLQDTALVCALKAPASLTNKNLDTNELSNIGELLE